MDKRPKRRKSKDNPYILECNKELNIYKVTFYDGKGILRVIQISKEMYEIILGHNHQKSKDKFV